MNGEWLERWRLMCTHRVYWREFHSVPRGEWLRRHLDTLNTVHAVRPDLPGLLLHSEQQGIAGTGATERVRLDPPNRAVIRKVDAEAVHASKPYGLQGNARSPAPHRRWGRPLQIQVFPARPDAREGDGFLRAVEPLEDVLKFGEKRRNRRQCWQLVREHVRPLGLQFGV